jgi:hypothetical protein
MILDKLQISDHRISLLRLSIGYEAEERNPKFGQELFTYFNGIPLSLISEQALHRVWISYFCWMKGKKICNKPGFFT